LSVRKDGGDARPLRTSKDYFPSQDVSLGPVSRFFDGESTTEVGLDTSLHNDIWAAVAPDTAKLRDRIDEGDKLFDKAADDLTVEQANEFLALALRGLIDRYAQSPPPARFRLEVNPMVTWIWIGGLIVLLGGFIAAWPAKRGTTRVASARYAAQVGRDVREPESVPA
jgi:cytochrome c-type biogenesis protein CcmF